MTRNSSEDTSFRPIGLLRVQKHNLYPTLR